MRILIRVILPSLVLTVILFVISNTLANSMLSTGGLANSNGWPVVYSYQCSNIPGYESLCSMNKYSVGWQIFDYSIWLIPLLLLLSYRNKTKS